MGDDEALYLKLAKKDIWNIGAKMICDNKHVRPLQDIHSQFFHITFLGDQSLHIYTFFFSVN